mmetsp:Transcript_757/g.1220  ORF Transcript_757/g.1220 Transcript_757/m.1220 type:complete len:112 (+) Transcript_757:805-1140(+)
MPAIQAKEHRTNCASQLDCILLGSILSGSASEMKPPLASIRPFRVAEAHRLFCLASQDDTCFVSVIYPFRIKPTFPNIPINHPPHSCIGNKHEIVINSKLRNCLIRFYNHP